MSGSLAAIIVLPIVALIALGVWLAVVLRASARRPPAHGPAAEPVHTVAGGVFYGDPRQVTAEPGAPAQDRPAQHRNPPHRQDAGATPDASEGATPDANG
jgi:hypothetical protein